MATKKKGMDFVRANATTTTEAYILFDKANKEFAKTGKKTYTREAWQYLRYKTIGYGGK